MFAKKKKCGRPGICGFEEVFNTEPLQKAIQLSGVYGPNAKLLTYGADGTGPTVALVSNYPVLESSSIPNFPPEALINTEAGALPIKARFTQSLHVLTMNTEVLSPRAQGCDQAQYWYD